MSKLKINNIEFNAESYFINTNEKTITINESSKVHRFNISEYTLIYKNNKLIYGNINLGISGLFQ